MKATVKLTGAIAVLACLPLTAQEPTGSARGGLAERFDRLDRNKDGKLSERELDRGTVFRMLDTDKDSLLTREEFLKIAERWRARPDRKELAHPKTRQDPDGTALTRLIYQQDYRPGTRDPNGVFMGGTTALFLQGHKGMLFASIGYAIQTPGAENPGGQILRKDGPDSPWIVDVSCGPNYIRAEAILSVTFDTDSAGAELAEPVTLLLAAPAEKPSSDSKVSVFTRDDSSGKWLRGDLESGRGGARSLGVHRDKVTGVQSVFAGLNAGKIYRGSYDPKQESKIQWQAEPELALPGNTTYREYNRVMAFAVCNGDLYAAINIKDRPSGATGGVYRRIDGRNPSWELVYRWPYDKEIVQSIYLRGITAVPDPDGADHEVLIAGLEYPGHILRIDPTKLDAQGLMAGSVELDMMASFRKAYGQINNRRGVICAYNRFLPVRDPATGEPVWLTGTWVGQVGGPRAPFNGTDLLIRHADASYENAYIHDPGDPSRLAGCRDIEPSPFPKERGRVYYLCGYDGGAGRGSNTAWICRGTRRTGEEDKP
jgi:hypothetical protein